MTYRKRRLVATIVILLISLSLQLYQDWHNRQSVAVPGSDQTTSANTDFAKDVLKTIEVKGRAPKTDYKRSNFGDGWQQVGACDTRNKILARDLEQVVYKSASNCDVVSGVLKDPYTNKTINFQRGAGSSDDVQIDHVVALSDAWQKGAQALSFDKRVLLANDGLNLLAVDGQTNQDKGSSDAASWLPPNKAYRCIYVARQIAVKKKYGLWVTLAEKQAMESVLDFCPDQRLPEVIAK